MSPSIGVLNRVWSALQKKLNPPLTASAIEECVAVWLETLKKFNAQRPIMPSEKAAIGRAIQAAGNDPEPVKLALYGARYEQGSDKFNPAQHLSVIRVLDPKNFARFMSIGAQERSKRQQHQAPAAPVQSTPTYQPQEPVVEPEKVPMTAEARKMLEGLGILKPLPPTASDVEERKRLLRQQAERLAQEGGEHG